MTIPKNGYLYVWVSNETQGWDVFFDNLSVQHKQGPLLEENHYYPFGLAMEGLSDKAIKTNYTENKFRYNSGSELQNKEFSDGTGWEMYETQYRGYDPQIGRFGEIDPLADRNNFVSTYQFADDNPVSSNDPTGMYAQYQPQPVYSPVNNMNPQYGGPSIDEINSITGYNSDLGADAGEENDAIYKGNGVYQLPNGEYVDQYTAINYSIDKYGGSMKSYTISNYSSKEYYAYSNANGSVAFETPNNDGVYTEQEEGSFYFTGKVQETSFDISYLAGNQGSEDDLTWWDYTKTSVALAGAIVETAVGGLTSETGVGGVVAYDGAIRVAGNFSKLVGMIETGSKSKSELIPTNGGAIIGAIIDHGTGKTGQMQSVLGTVNDVGSMIFSVSSGYEILDNTDQMLNHFDRPGPWPGIYDDYHTIKEYY